MPVRLLWKIPDGGTTVAFSTVGRLPVIGYRSSSPSAGLVIVIPGPGAAVVIIPHAPVVFLGSVIDPKMPSICCSTVPLSRGTRNICTICFLLEGILDFGLKLCRSWFGRQGNCWERAWRRWRGVVEFAFLWRGGCESLCRTFVVWYI